MKAIIEQIIRFLGSRHARRRLGRALPVLGFAFAAYSVFQRVRTKGVGRGGLDALLDLTPVVGRIKAVYEAFAGDIITPARAH